MGNSHNNESICPSGVRFLSIREVLTKEVEDDLIKYTCSSTCSNDTNICYNAQKMVIYLTRFNPFLSNWSIVQVPADTFLTINDLEVEDWCEFNTSFYQSTKFCDSSTTSSSQYPNCTKKISFEFPITFVISCGIVKSFVVSRLKGRDG